MTSPRRLLERPDDIALFDDPATRRLEQHAAAALPPHALMARAGLALLRLARAIAPNARSAWIAAGPGNNGGDGLVLATWLHRAGVDVRVTLVGHRADRALPDDAAWALAEARAAGVALAARPPAAAELAGIDLAVDALLGVGQSRAPDGAMADVVALLNGLRCPVLAVDAPTGLSTASGAQLGAAAVRATHTLALLTAKPGLFTGAGRELAGDPWFDDLGVAPQDVDTARLTGSAAAGAVLPARRHLANKGSFGDVHVAGGAAGMVGASLLAAHAAALAGAGRVLVHTHASDAGGALPVDVRHPELMLRPLAELQATLRANRKATVVAGCGGGDAVAAELPGCLANAARLVLDADALNAIARDTSLRALLRARAARGSATILTPHPLEAARLLGGDCTAADVQADRLAAARRLAAELHAVVVLKGSGTLVASPDGRVSVNPTGDARLATAGTGDVLAGWIGGLWCAQAPQGDALAQAHAVARAAAWIHGQAVTLAPGDRLPLVAGELAALMGRVAQAQPD